MLEHRAKVRGAAAGELQRRHVAVKLSGVADDRVVPELVVALENVDVEPAREGVGRAQDRVGVLEEAAHQLARGGHGRVHGDDQLLDARLLLRLGRLDQRHVAVQAQAVAVVAVVEGVDVALEHLARGGEAAQEAAVVHIVARGDGELLGHGLAARALGREQAADGALRLGGELLPVLVLPLALLPVARLLRVPQTVVVQREGAAELGELVVRALLGQEHAVDALGGQDLHLRAALAPELFAHGRVDRRETRQCERVQHALDRGVAGQIPERGVPAPALAQVAEQTVQHAVQVQAADRPGRAQVERREIGGVYVIRAAVGGRGDGDAVPRHEGQRAERRGEVGQAHAQPGARVGQDVRRDGAEIVRSFHSHSSQLFCRGGNRRRRCSSSRAAPSVNDASRAASSASASSSRVIPFSPSARRRPSASRVPTA